MDEALLKRMCHVEDQSSVRTRWANTMLQLVLPGGELLCCSATAGSFTRQQDEFTLSGITKAGTSSKRSPLVLIAGSESALKSSVGPRLPF